MRPLSSLNLLGSRSSLLLQFGIFAVDQRVEGGEREQRQQRRADQAADYDGGDGFLHLGAGSGRERHRQEAERGDERCHGHRSQARHRASEDRRARRQPAIHQLADVGAHHEAVEDGDAGKRDETHRRRDRHGHAA